MSGQSEPAHSARPSIPPPMGDTDVSPTGIGSEEMSVPGPRKYISQGQTLSAIRGIRKTGTLLVLPTLSGSYQRESDIENI